VPLYGITIFLGAFLLFQVQPLIARYILPWYGGGPGVWTACMLFFQVTLLAGYAYAHLVSARLSVRRQVIVHAALLAIALPLVSIAPDAAWKPTGNESPTLSILALLAAHIGFPFAVLASTSPLLARWFSCRWPERNPYRLYALSNAGSLLALLSYPFLVEPNLRLATQGNLWQMGFAVFVLVCVASAWKSRDVVMPEAPQPADDAQPTRDPLALWIALAATGSVLLIATTSRISEDLAVTPSLWVLPLSIYLVSFIIAFDHERWYLRRVFLPLFACVAGLLSGVLALKPDWVTFEWMISLYSTLLFAGTMVCHGELVRAKPAPAHLTRFYLAVSAGGALGGVFVGIVAPAVFSEYWEYPIAVLGAGALAAHCVVRDRVMKPVLAWSGGGVLLIAIAVGFAWDSYESHGQAIETSRTFFGVIHVRPHATQMGETRFMQHGHIDHGTQFVNEKLRHISTGYYGKFSGVGMAIDRYRALVDPGDRGIKIGIIGLGTGALCTYGRGRDTIRIYEIDSEVERLARKHFTYLKDCKGAVSVLIGDARIVLERELAKGSQQFDLLVVDAFSSDAIPVHLLTREAIALYVAHLKPGGALALHTSNVHLAVPAVARGCVEDAGLEACRIIDVGDARYAGSPSDWVIASMRRDFIDDYDMRVASTPWSEYDREPILWTDDFSSLWTARTQGTEVGRWRRAPNQGKFVVDFANLISYDDRKAIEDVCRKLHFDSGGSMTMVAMNIKNRVRTGVKTQPLSETGSAVYRTMRMGKGKRDMGLLILVAAKARVVNLQMGTDWPSDIRKPIRDILETILYQGIRNGYASLAFRQTVERIDRLVRERAVKAEN